MNETIQQNRVKTFGDGIVSVTWSGLTTLRNGGNLMPNQTYRITDYTCTTTTTGTQSAGHVFDILVTADDVNKLNENAQAIQHSGDTYFSNCKLESWELKYCLDNDANRFDWADTENGKGVIYYMKDEYNNECPYDFKNIQYSKKVRYDSDNNVAIFDEVSGSTQWLYTFTAYDVDNSQYIDAYKANGRGYYNEEYEIKRICEFYGNVIKPYMFDNDERQIRPKPYHLNGNIFLNTFMLNNKVFICKNNVFGNDCQNNTFGNNCYSNTFGNDCQDNTFGNDCESITFGNNCTYNTFGNTCFNNTFGNNCQNNTFRHNCSSNTFGDICYSNTFGYYCRSNTFGDNCYSNTFGDSFRDNIFGNGCMGNTFGADVIYFTVNNGLEYCNFSTNYTTGSMSYLQNIQVLNGVQGSYSSPLVIPVGLVVGANYTQCVCMGADGNVLFRTW